MNLNLKHKETYSYIAISLYSGKKNIPYLLKTWSQVQFLLILVGLLTTFFVLRARHGNKKTNQYKCNYPL